MAKDAELILANSALLAGMDRSTEEGFAAALKLLAENVCDPAFAALVLNTKAEYVAENVSSSKEPDRVTSVATAAWSAGVAAALLRFKLHFEEAAYRGNSLEKIRWLISEWSKNQTNASEAFWQELLLSRPFALSQLFAAPVVIHGERFLVGGVRAGGQHGKISDFLLRNQLTDAAVIVELKTPTAPLLYESEYRQDVFAPSRELSGAVQQVLEQRAQFMKQMQALQAELEPTEPRVEIVEPHCAVVIGNTAQLDSRARRRSFEAYRTELRNVRIVTFDEMFTKLTGLSGLLGGHLET